ncbi:protein phosphatase 1 regulatory subunit 16A isoform X3 [Drosophila bipectinata]|uniref:protein phosphatase 1 regulatory subunit 16A isoform X3 n=1 Tax=Drosophila bipectinata TaxID=42026 RepID=UPI0038B3D004
MIKGILIQRKSQEDASYTKQLKMEHADLVAEMQTVESLPTHERLQLARLRRAQQLKLSRQKEKEWAKLQRAKGNSGGGSGVLGNNLMNGNADTTHHFRHANGSGTVSGRRHISFENSVVLLEAASRNDMPEVAALLQHGITPDAANEDGLTAMHQACIDNNVEMLQLLLEYGANVDAQDSDKWTPLHAAATCGHLELVRILIRHGANLLAVNTDGNMPYDLCDDENTLDFIEGEMAQRGVTQELIDETRSSTERIMLRDLMELARTGGDLEEPDYQCATPLHIAAANGYVRVVEFLLEQHVNVDAMDKDLWTPVHAAACWGHLEVLEMLAQCGADLNVRNKDDETPSDICEDPEIRERIEQLKTEQESKRLAEAQRRRVRRSQSNNTSPIGAPYELAGQNADNQKGCRRGDAPTSAGPGGNGIGHLRREWRRSPDQWLWLWQQQRRKATLDGQFQRPTTAALQVRRCAGQCDGFVIVRRTDGDRHTFLSAASSAGWPGER